MKEIKMIKKEISICDICSREYEYHLTKCLFCDSEICITCIEEKKNGLEYRQYLGFYKDSWICESCLYKGVNNQLSFQDQDIFKNAQELARLDQRVNDSFKRIRSRQSILSKKLEEKYPKIFRGK